ncbi:hypothetical protein AXG93_2884s1000 [Marchantia polymorpha subsp. ruderalis]|uniref:Uncharacterized protein n=1 Tax=Marchantia polymorpha subsp. ruderalis TaxID=1480154 RepID=A0A176WKP9_MARPO|nr:hypothetical protein AXG93_2884s1000 [Marchantia polymorpha subsp. ruderalis]
MDGIYDQSSYPLSGAFLSRNGIAYKGGEAISKGAGELIVESSQGTEDENRSPAVPTHTTARGPVQVDVVPRQEQPERRVAKKRKVVSDDEEELAHTVRRMDMDVSGARQHRARARPKKRAKRRMVTVEVSDSSVEKTERRVAKKRKVTAQSSRKTKEEGETEDVTIEVSDSSVEKTVAPIVNTSKVAASEVMRPVEIGVPSEVSIEVPADIPAEPLKEGTKLVSPISLSSERTRFAQGEGTPQMKTNEDLEKEFTLSEEILEQVVARVGGTVVEAEGITLPTSPVEEVRPEEGEKTSGEDVKTLEITFPEFLQDSVVPLLKYLDGKRGKYAVSKELGFYVQMIKNRTKLKRAIAVKREWDSTTALARERAATLSTECAAVKATLREREAQLREKETECEVLQLNLEKESGRCAELEETCGGLRVSNENAQKVTVDLMSRLEKFREAYDAAIKRSERLITTAEKREKMHVEKLAKLEARRAEEARIAEELRGKLAGTKTAEEDLRREISEIDAKYEMEFRRAEELSASLLAGNQKYGFTLCNLVDKIALQVLLTEVGRNNVDQIVIVI